MWLRTVWAPREAHGLSREVRIEWRGKGTVPRMSTVSRADHEEVRTALLKGKKGMLLWIARDPNSSQSRPPPDAIRIEDEEGNGVDWIARNDSPESTQHLACGKCYTSHGRRGEREHIFEIGRDAPGAPTREERPQGWLNPAIIDIEWTERGAQERRNKDERHSAQTHRGEELTLLDIMVLDEPGCGSELRERALAYAELSAQRFERSPASALALGPHEKPGCDACLAFVLLDALGGTFMLDLGAGSAPRLWTQRGDRNSQQPGEENRPWLASAMIKSCMERLEIERSEEAIAQMRIVPTLNVRAQPSEKSKLREGHHGAVEHAEPLAPRSRVLVRFPQAPPQCDAETLMTWERERATFALEVAGGREREGDRWSAQLRNAPKPQSKEPWDPYGAYWGDALYYAAFAKTTEHATPVGGWHSTGLRLGESKLGGTRALMRIHPPARIKTPRTVRIVTAR